MIWLLIPLVVLMVFHNPIVPIVYLMRLPVQDKGRIVRCFLNAWFRNLLTIIPDLLAPVVVPVALLFTKWEDEKLPKLFKWWDNDVTINGDRSNVWVDGKPVIPLEDTPEARALAFWVDGKHHPRSFYARWVWMGLRNRASMLSQMLGDKDPAYMQGHTVLWQEGANYLIRAHDRYRLSTLIPFGPVFLRVHYGFKVGWPTHHGGPIAIGFSLRAKK
jgi:hypothetical protein